MSQFRIRSIGFTIFTLFISVAGAVAQNFSYTTPLVAGRLNNIGDVRVERDGDSLDVTYTVTDSNWFITKTYLHVTDNSNGFPTTVTGVPNIQQFTYKTDHGKVYTYKYDNLDVTGQPYTYVSANANVTEESSCKIDTSIINSNVPKGQVFMRLALSFNPAYFNMYIYDYNGDPIYNGFFFGNCVDLENPIQQGRTYFPKLVSSYTSNQALLSCIVDKPENLDVANYMINQDYAAKFGATGTDVQAAIWTVLDDNNPQNGAFGLFFNQSTVNKIVKDASAKGEFYVPGCGDKFIILVDQGCKDALANNTTPIITVQQSMFWLPLDNYSNSYEFSFGECANAWGIGKKFSNTGWGQFFEAK